MSRVAKIQVALMERLLTAGMSPKDCDEFSLFLALCVEKRPLDDVVSKHPALLIDLSRIVQRYGINADRLRQWVAAAKDVSRTV
jgi:hypothetical protein